MGTSLERNIRVQLIPFQLSFQSEAHLSSVVLNDTLKSFFRVRFINDVKQAADRYVLQEYWSNRNVGSN